ncbi:MAG TPA: serine/threonine-protein kinase, partial [Spirochaetota bacterium]|nr:serine/threonine-protein kinase [Spirochaetota bacterium]
GFNHENIVKVYDHFSDQGNEYIVMEYIDGLTLEQLLKRKRKLTNAAAVYIGKSISKALHFAHCRGVVHRDVKPANILVGRDGSIKLTDFGIAAAAKDQAANITRKGVAMGTPSYMAPEQFRDVHTVDKRADIYALGIMLYEMVTGSLPYRVTDIDKGYAQVCSACIVSPSRAHNNIDRVLSKIIKKAVRKNRYKRFQSAAFILNRLEKRMSKYFAANDTAADLKKHLAAYVFGTGKDIGSQHYRLAGVKKIFTRRKIVYAAVIILTLFFISMVYDQLRKHKYFLSKSKGGLIVRLALAADKYSITNEKNNPKAVLYNKSNRQYNIFRRISFRKDEDKKAGNITFASARMFIPACNYRLKLYFDNRQYIKDFFLKPEAEQTGAGLPEQCINLKCAVRIKIPLRVSFNIKDAVSHAKIDPDIYIYYDNDWMRWSFYSRWHAEKIVSGREYSFKLTDRHYYRKYFQLKVAPDRRKLVISAEMIPCAARLQVSSQLPEKPDYDFLLDNKGHVLSGGRKPVFININKELAQKQYLTLAPGRYLLLVKKDSRVHYSKSIKLRPGGKKTLEIKKNRKGETRICLNR